MYHDQGQIAMKLIGFDRGVTILGGFPFPLLTAVHGSACDIAGKGLADPGASRLYWRPRWACAGVRPRRRVDPGSV
jgi:4-hydroxy-L-threonine phosphate dehydrogenase PdxA